MIQLWPHQQQSIDLLRKALASGKRKPMLQVPTGGGKTRTPGAIVELMRQRDKRAVFIADAIRSEEHTSELQSLRRISYAAFCLNHHNFKRRQSQDIVRLE